MLTERSLQSRGKLGVAVKTVGAVFKDRRENGGVVGFRRQLMGASDHSFADSVCSQCL